MLMSINCLRCLRVTSSKLFCISFPRRIDTSASVSNELLFTKNHEWVKRLQQESNPQIVQIGITDYAQKSLGDLVYVELPKVGSTISKDDAIGVVESVKGASDIYAPISGSITRINDAAVNKPSLVNKAAETDGWLCEVKVDDNNQLSSLLSKEEYQSFCGGK